MIRFFFLIPILMCLIWALYLRAKGYSLKDGANGFKHIIIFNTVIIGFFVIMILVTDYP